MPTKKSAKSSTAARSSRLKAPAKEKESKKKPASAKATADAKRAKKPVAAHDDWRYSAVLDASPRPKAKGLPRCAPRA